MARAENKTVRFTRVVERSGQPHVHTLWVTPDKDPELKRARDAQRVMTVARREGAGKSDVGLVGFDPKRDAGAQVLIFPKSLKPFQDARVVGIKFDLVEQPEIVPATADDAAQRARSRHRTRQAAGTKTKHREHSSISADTPAAAGKSRDKSESSPAERSSAMAGLPARGKNQRSPPKRARRETRVERAPTPARESEPRAGDYDSLAREVRAAMKELEAGKAVAAHQRLERALRKSKRQ